MAVAARAAWDLRVHDHPLATGEPGYVGADLDDFAGELVTYRHTRSGERVLAGGYVQIRAAQPRSLDPNLQLASARRRHLPVYEVYIPPAVPDDAAFALPPLSNCGG
ncbi:MAG TPA: hypothetical protein VFH16_19890 [Rubrobacter sp.]|nr:hypothetical protein [Rubrobacter sp.]